MDVVGANKAMTVKVSDIEDTGKFIKEANTAVEVAKGIDGVSLGYDAGSKGVEVKVPGLDGQVKNATTVKVSDIGTEEGSSKKFIDGYEAAKALAGVSGSDEPNVKSQQYNKSDGSWNIELAGAGTAVNGSTVFKVKVTDDGVDITVTDIKYANGMSAFMSNPMEANALKTEINNAFKDAKNQVGNIDGNITKTVQEIAINAAQKMMNDNKTGEPNFVGPVANVGGVNPLQSLAINNFAKNLLGLSSGKDRTIYNETKGTVTQYSADGSTVQLKLKTGEGVSGDFDYNEFKNRLQSEGFDRALDYAKCYGAVETITAKNKDGDKIYEAKNIGYNENDHCIALQYSFGDKYDYTDLSATDQVYFKDATAGSEKVLVENFWSQDNQKKERAMVYSVGGEETEYVTNNGMKIKASISGLDKVTEWSEEDGNQVAKTVDFVDGKEKGENGDIVPSGFEKTVIGKDGESNTTRYNLNNAYRDEELTSSDNGGGNDDDNKGIVDVDEYKQVLDNANKLNLNGNGSDKFYGGYDYVSNGWIDQEKIGLTTTNVSNQGNETKYNYKLKDGNWELISGSVDYKKNTEISAAFGCGLDGDTVTLHEDVSFNFNVADGKVEGIPDDAIKALQGGTYNNKYTNTEGKSVTATGSLEDISIEVNDSGQIGLSGRVVIDDKNTFGVKKGESNGEGGEGGSKPDAKDTRAKITETEDGYELSGTDEERGTVSLRSGALVVEGEGATALDGSQFITGFGTVDVHGEYQFSNGAWVNSDENSYYTYHDTTEAKEKINDYLDASGLKSVNDIDVSQQQKGIISSDKSVMFNNFIASVTNGIDVEVVNDNYVSSDGISLEKGTKFNISVINDNGTNVIVLKANEDLKATYELSEGWSASNGETSFTQEFKNGEYITVAALLNKAQVESITGNVNWNGVDIPNVTINVTGGDNANYKNYDACSLNLAGNGDTVEDVNGNPIGKTNLVGEYNGKAFTILEGAKVKLLAGGKISVVNGDVYADGMVIKSSDTNKPNGPDEKNTDTEPESQTESEETEQKDDKIDSYFEGYLTKDEEGNILATGIFRNYSDANIDQVFSEQTIYNVGSVYVAGSIIKGEKIDYESKMTEDGIVLTDKGRRDYVATNTEDIDKINSDMHETFGEDVNVDENGYVHFKGKDYDIFNLEDMNKLYELKGQYDYAKNIANEAKSVFGDNISVDGTTIKVGDKTYDVTKEDDLKALNNLANDWQYAKVVAEQAESVYGKGNVKIDGTKITVDGKTYDVSTEQGAADLSKIMATKNVESYLSTKYDMNEYSIVYNSDGTVRGVSKKSDMKNENGEGWFDLANDTQIILADGTKKWVEDDEVIPVTYDNNTLTITEDNRWFLNFGGSVDVTEVSFDANGGYSETDMHAGKFLWFINTGTSATVTNYGADGSKVGESQTYSGYSHFWDFGDSQCGELLDYAKGKTDGNVTICQGVTLYGSKYTINENDMYGLDVDEYSSGNYRQQGVRLTEQNSGTVHVSEKIFDEDTLRTVVSTSYDIEKIEGNPDAKGLDFKTADTGIFDVNAKITNKTTTINDANGFQKAVYDYSSTSGEAYVNDDGKVIAESFTSGTVTDSYTGQKENITQDNPSVYISNDYYQQRMKDLGDIGYGNCVALANSGIDTTFNYNGKEYNLNDCYFFYEQSGGKTTVTVMYWDAENNKLVKMSGSANNTEDDAAVDIFQTTKEGENGNRVSLEKGDVMETLVVKMNGDALSVSKEQSTVNGTRTYEVYNTGDDRPSGHVTEPTYDSTPIETFSVSYGDNGDVTTSSMKVLRDDNGALTGKLAQSNRVLSLDGSSNNKYIVATFSDSGYDGTAAKEFFENKNQKYKNVSGYEVSINSKGEYVSFTTIGEGDGQSAISYTFDDKDRTTSVTYDNYSQTEYKIDGSAEIDFSLLNASIAKNGMEGSTSKYLSGLDGIERRDTTVLNGTTYTVYESGDLKKITEKLNSDIPASDLTFPSGAESVTINDGVTKKVYDRNMNQKDEEITTTVEATYPTKYSVDGEKYVSSDDLKDDEIPRYSKSETDTLYSRVESFYENGKKLENGESIVTKTDPYKTTTINYLELGSQTMIINGKTVQVPSITSETTKTGMNGSGFTQTVTRGDVTTKTVGYKETTSTYSDGTEQKVASANYEQKQEYDENGKAIITTEYDVKEIKNTDANGNSYTDRTAATATVSKEDGEFRYSENINVHTAIENGEKTEETTVGSSRVYKEYTDEEGNKKTLMTVSENSNSVKEYDEDGKLMSSYEDTGNYYVAEGVTNVGTVDEHGKLRELGDTSKAIVIRQGRDISEEKYTYTDKSSKPDTVEYSRTSYDYTAGVATKTEGTKKNKYDDKDNLIETTDTSYARTFGLNSDSSINDDDLQKEEYSYSREYNIKKSEDGRTTTSDFENSSAVYDYRNGQYYVSSNSGHSEVTTDTEGKIIDKTVTGDAKYWTFDSAESLDSLGIRNGGTQNIDVATIENSGGYLDASRSYQYTNTNYTYDYLGRETGYDFNRTYYIDPVSGEKGTNYTGKNTTSYTYTEIEGAEIDGMKVVSTTSTSISVSDSTELDKNTQYYSNSGIGNTSVYSSIGTFGISFANVSSIANDVLQNMQIRKDFVGMTTAKQDAQSKADVKVLVVVAAVIATIAVTVATVFSFGAASPAYAGVAALWGAVGLTGTALTVATAATIVATTIVASYFAAKYSAAAVDCAYAGDWAGFGMNAVFALTAIFGGAKFLQGLGALGVAAGQEGLKILGKQLLKTALKRAAVGAAVGATATAAFMTADHYITGRDYTFGEAARNIAMGALAGGLAGALTTNIGGVMGKAGMLEGLASAQLKQLEFANMILNLGKNMLLAGNVLKSAGNYIISDSGFDISQQKSMINIFDSAVDIYMFMSAGARLETGAAGQEQVAKKFGQILRDTFTKEGLIGGGLGAAVFAGGSIVYQATNGFKDSWNLDNVNWLTVGQLAFAGFVLGGGIGNVQHVGWKNAYKGAWTALKAGLAPTQLFTNSVQMISRIMQMQMIVTGGGAVLENITGGWFTKILEYTGIGLVDEAFSKMGVGMNLIGNMRDLAANLTLEGISNFASQTKSTMTEPSMWIFSVATAVAQPILSPILLRTPILGTTMQFMNRFGDRVSDIKGAGEMLNMVYEEGFKESISGLFGQMVFGNSQFGEIFQELFDETPDGLSDINLLASANIDSALVSSVVTNINKANKSKDANVDTVIQQSYEQLGLNSGNSTITFDMFKSAISSAIGSKNLNTTINDILLANSIAQKSGNATNSEIETIMRTWNDGIDSINAQLSSINNKNSSKGRQLANELATFQTARDNEVQSARVATQAILTNIQSARSSIINGNKKLSENQILNAVYAQTMLGENIKDVTPERVSEMLSTDNGIQIFTNYIDYLAATGNTQKLTDVAQQYVQQLNEQLNNIKDDLSSKDTSVRENANHQILRNMTALQFVMTAADSLSIRSIDAENVTAENVMTQLQNLADSNNLENLKKDIESKLKEENISETEQKLYSRINEILTSGDYSAADIRLILNTNSNDFFVQNDNLSDHGRDLRKVRNEIMSLAKSAMMDKIQSINTSVDTGDYDLAQAMGLLQQVNANLNVFGNLSSDYVASLSIKDMMSEISSLSKIQVDKVLQTAEDTKAEREAKKDFEKLLKGKKTVLEQLRAVDQELSESKYDNPQSQQDKALKALLMSYLSNFNILSIVNKSEVKDLTTEDINKINDFILGRGKFKSNVPDKSNDLKSNTVKKYVYAQLLGIVRDRMQQSEEFKSRKDANKAITEVYAKISECKGTNKTLAGIFEGTDIENVLGVFGNIEVTDSLIEMSNIENAVQEADRLFNKGTDGEWHLKAGEGKVKGQIDSVRDILNGENLAILAAVGYGKTAIPVGVALGRSAMGMVNMDLVVANGEEFNKYLNNKFDTGHTKTIRDVIELSGAKVYDMDTLAEKAMHGTQADIDVFREAMLDKNGFRIWTGEKMGFLGTQAASEAASNGRVELQQILDEFQAQTDRLTIADEVHKFMESQTSFILSSGSESLTKSKSWNQENNPKLEQAYDYAKQLFESGVVDVDAEGIATISKDLSRDIDAFAKKNNLNRTWVDSAIKAVVEKATGKDTYGIATQPDGSKHIVPVSNGNKEDGRVFQDVAYAYAASREMGNGHSQALQTVQISKTDFGTSGSRLFFGAGQYVGMSGTLAHVQDMAASFGMEIRVYGAEKDFKLVSDPKQLGDMQKDDVLFKEVKGNDLDEIRKNMVEQMFEQIKQNLTDQDGNSKVDARTQLIMSVDENVRNELIRKLTEEGLADRILQITTETENTTDIIDQTMKDEEGETIKIKQADGKKYTVPVGGKDAKIIICNEKGAMGLDYAGNFDLLVDSTGASSSLLTQTYGRVNRHVETAGEKCTRTLYANTYEIDSLMEDLNNPIILSGIYSQLSNSPSALDKAMAERLFEVVNGEVKIRDTIVVDEAGNVRTMNKSEQQVRNFELAKAYSLFKQSGQSLIFGLADSIRDVYLTKAFNDLIVQAGGKDTLEGAIIYKVLQDQLLNHEEGANTRTEKGDIVDGNRQMEQRIKQLQTEALEAFRAVQTHLREVNGSSNIIDSVTDNISAWENVNISSKDSVISKAITRTTSLQEAVDIMMSYGNNVVASYGNNGNVEGAPTVIADVSKNLQDAGITDYESLSEALSSDPTLSVNGQLTYLGQQVVENYKRMNNLPYDDDFIKVIMALFGMLGIDLNMGGQSLQSLEKAERSSLFTKASVRLAKENISVDKLMTFANIDIAKEITEIGKKEDKALMLKQILNAEYPLGLKEYLAQNSKDVILPDPMLLKAMDIISNEEGGNNFYKQLQESYNQIVNSFEQAKYAGSRLSAYDRANTSSNSKVEKVFDKMGSLAKMFLNYMLVMPCYTAIRSVAGEVIGTAIMSTSKGIKLLPEKTDNETYNKLKELGIPGIMKAAIYGIQDRNLGKNIERKINKNTNKMNELLEEYNRDLSDILKDVSKENEIEKYVTEKLQTRGIYDVDVVVRDGRLEIKTASTGSLNTLNADLLIQEIFGISPEQDGYYDVSKMTPKISQETKVSLKSQMAFTQEISGTDELVDTIISLSLLNEDMLKGIGIKNIKKLSVFNDVVEKVNKENSVDGKMTKALSSLTQEDVQAIINSFNPKVEMNRRLKVEVGSVEDVIEDNITDITARVNEARKAKGVAKAEDSQDVSSDQVQEMLLESCAVEAMKGITKVVPMIRLVDGLTKMAIEMATGESKYEGLDSLKAAGEKEAASIGIIKDITEYEYATVKDIEAITSPVIAYFDKNHVAKVSSKAEIEAVEKQGYKFTGLVLADKKDIASNEGLAEDILLNRVYGVMKASEVSGIVEYLTAVFKKGNREEEMKKYIGISGEIAGEEGRIKINEAVINEIEKVTREGAEGKVPKFIVEAHIKALTGIREMLMVASYKSSEEPGWLDSEGTSEEDIVKEIDARRTVNQSVITQSVSSGKINTDFVINVVKLQEAVTEKGLSKKMAEIQKLINSGKPDLGAIMDIQGKEDLRMPMDLFRMSDVHAVAASA